MITEIVLVSLVAYLLFKLIFKKSEIVPILDYFDTTTYKTTINVNDFKEGDYIKCVTDELRKYEKGRIYKIEKITRISNDFISFSYLDAIISGDIFSEIILSRSSSKFIIFTNWRHFFIPKFIWVPIVEKVNFVLAKDYEIRAQTYNV